MPASQIPDLNPEPQDETATPAGKTPWERRLWRRPPQQDSPATPAGEVESETHVYDSRRSGTAVSRRTFVGLSLGTMAAWLGACGPTPPPTGGPSTEAAAWASPAEIKPPARSTPVPPTATLTTAPAPSATARPAVSPTALAASVPPGYSPVPATPTQPPPPTATPTPALDRTTLRAHWPAVATSRVVLVRNSNVWAGDAPDPAVVLSMLDDGLRTLAGVPDALAVWRTLFSAGESVLLKVNCIAYGGPTHPAVTHALAQRLQEAGLAAESLLIFDRTDNELEAAGYVLNEGGPGVQCHGSRGKGTEAALSQATVRFFQELDACDALINLAIPKQHGTAGISVSLKNHYGSVDSPGKLHSNRCDPAIPELNAQPTLRTKTRLVVGAALTLSPGDWNRPERDNAILLSFDPVALDTVARDLLVQHRRTQGIEAGLLIDGPTYLRTAQSLGLGATEPSLIDLMEVNQG